ncbi:MAG: hypothetical protein HY751_03570 [Nitrospinae bacterium]|nr:hypothetical protein [Nitrospinota bacterium]
MTRKKKLLALAVVAITIKVVAIMYVLNWFTLPGAAEAQTQPTAAEETANGKESTLQTGGAPKPKKIEEGALDIEILQEVEKRQKTLDAKEEELKQKEERLNALQTDLDKQISELQATQAKIDDLIKQRGDLEETSVQKLAKTYSSMAPENAAALIQQLDPAIAVRVISAMKERNAARVLSAMPADIASKLSEKIVKKR